MRTREDIEAYLMRSGLPYEEVAPETWVVREAGGNAPPIVVRLADDLVLFRTKVIDLSAPLRKLALYEKLLELNANELLHGAYGISDGSVVLTFTMRLENLDYAEFVGTLDDFALAIRKHVEALSAYREAPAAH
jgi:hypothetical protein